MAETIEDLKTKLKLYEENGAAKLYYALQRKMNEMADMLNSVSLKTLDIAAKSDASFERVFKLLEKSETVSASAKALGDVAGVTGDEKKDVERKPFIEEVAETRK